MAISAGDIAFVGANSTNPDQFSFVARNALVAGDSFIVTDGGYTGVSSGPASGRFRDSEGYLQYTVPAGGIPAGTVIVVNGGDTNAPSVSRNGGGNAGSVTLLPNSGGGTNAFDFSSLGESLTAYTVAGGTHLTGTPTLVAHVNFGTVASGSSNTTSSLTPTINGGQVLTLANRDNFIVNNSTTINPSTLTILQLSNPASFTARETTRYNLAAIVCFYPGTLIATPAALRAVEDLAIGDLVLTMNDTPVPIRWIGRQTVSTRFGDPLRVLPIRIMAEALSEGTPARDLLVSPDHALLVDGILIQAGALVNGTSITREHAVPEVFTYHHVELATHDLILAEGTPAETFVDNIGRMAFDNWDEHEALYGHLPSIPEMPFPRAKSHRQVPARLHALLAARAEAGAAAA